MHESLFLPRGPDDADDAPAAQVPGEDDGKGKEEEDDRKEYRAGNCNDCNRQFCLDYNLPICKGAGMEDVFTTCFRELGPSMWCGLLWGGGGVGNGNVRMTRLTLGLQSGTRERTRRWFLSSSLLRRDY